MDHPRRTARQRFTMLYTGLFLVSGIGLLILTFALSGFRETSVAPAHQPPAAPAERVRQLEAQLADVHAVQQRQLLVGSLLALAVMAVVSMLLGKAAARRVLRPLRTITATTRRITAENLHERLAVPGPDDEVKDLADTIDGLLARLEASFAAQRRFVANASHELRTPLATMRASLDVAAAKPRPAPQALALAARVRTELDRVDHLLEGLLALARAQHGALPDRARVGLAGVVTTALAARGEDIAAKELTVYADGVSDTGWTDGSPSLLARLADNLVDNAIVHNEPGGWIRVAAAPGRLVVENGGPVLDPAQVARLGTPFQRLAADRTGSDTGSGLGLSIVAAIAEAHGGRLDLHARPEGGLRVCVTL